LEGLSLSLSLSIPCIWRDESTSLSYQMPHAIFILDHIFTLPFRVLSCLIHATYDLEGTNDLRVREFG
jgi:hypothetical protein